MNKARSRWTILPGVTRGLGNQHLGLEGQISLSSFWVCPGVADAEITIIIEAQAWKGHKHYVQPYHLADDGAEPVEGK